MEATKTTSSMDGSRQGLPLLPAIVATVLCWTVAAATTPRMGIASLAYLAMVLGIAFRKERKLHATLMGLAITIDVGLVLFLQITRDAVGTAMGPSLTPMQVLHVSTSLLAVLMYAPLVYLGLKARRGEALTTERRNHRLIGMGAFLLRTAGFLSMFSMLGRGQG